MPGMVRSSFTSAPAIETDRLTLRAHRVDDFGEVAAMWADPDVVRYIGGKPVSVEDAWARLLRYAGHWALLRFGYWAVREKSSGRFAGEVGFAEGKRELEPSFAGAPEIGWALAPWAWGKGFATEAVRSVIDWGTAQLNPARTVCMIHPENAASVRVAQKCGYREFARTTYKGGPTLLFER